MNDTQIDSSLYSELLYFFGAFSSLTEEEQKDQDIIHHYVEVSKLILESLK
ncbi:MAG: hypothetical protein RLZZ196_3067 [Bacteroidota bacterium]|jgi:hypothetical protein